LLLGWSLARSADAGGTCDGRRIDVEILPTDGNRLPFVMSGEFDRSPFYGQLSVW
jgi:hypothetical protein